MHKYESIKHKLNTNHKEYKILTRIKGCVEFLKDVVGTEKKFDHIEYHTILNISII